MTTSQKPVDAYSVPSYKRLINSDTLTVRLSAARFRGQLNGFGITVTADTDDLTAVRDFVSRFPKAIRFDVSLVAEDGQRLGYAQFHAQLGQSYRNGVKNEAGIRKVRTILDRLNGVNFEWSTGVNGPDWIETLDEFIAELAVL